MVFAYGNLQNHQHKTLFNGIYSVQHHVYDHGVADDDYPMFRNRPTIESEPVSKTDNESTSDNYEMLSD